MRFFVALCYVMEATAIGFDVTFNIIRAYGIVNRDAWFIDKSDPFVGIFVDGRQIGLTPTRLDDHAPNWNTRIALSVDSADVNTWICIALFDRDSRLDNYRSTFDGVSLDRMKTQHHFMGSECANVIGWGDPGWRCSETRCPPVASNEKLLVCRDTSGGYCGTVQYELEIATNLPPPPPSPSPPPPPTPTPPPPTDFVEDMGEKAKDGISGMPAWLVAVLIGIGSVCALCCMCKYCCADDDDDPPSRSSVPAVHITRNHTGGAHHTEAGTELPGGRSSSSSPSSASGLQWNQWKALDRVLARTTHMQCPEPW